MTPRKLPALIFCCHVLFLSGSSVSAFRFDGGEGVGRPDFFGEAGLMNAVPRMGKRVGNPFDSRFRFRFNNWLANSRLNNNAGFRFQGGPDGTGYHVKKRREELNKRSMPVGVPAHAAPLAPPPVDPEDLAALAEDEARLQWYSVADEYWKEYLNDLTRKTAIEKMTVFPAPAQRPEHLGVGPDRPPLAGYYARKTAENPTGSNSSGRTDDAKVSSLLEAQLKAGGSGKFGPILRGNFKRK